jgi:hypothetical protein
MAQNPSMLGGHCPAEKYLCPRTRRIVTDSMSLRRNLRTVSSICLIVFGVAPSALLDPEQADQAPPAAELILPCHVVSTSIRVRSDSAGNRWCGERRRQSTPRRACCGSVRYECYFHMWRRTVVPAAVERS